MESGEILLTAVVIAMCIVPVYLLIRSGNARKRLLSKALSTLAKERKENLNFEIWSNKAIATDKKNTTLYYISTDDNNKVSEGYTINLQDVIKSRISIESSPNKKNPVIERIHLIIYLGGVNNKTINLCFYDQDVDDMIDVGYYQALVKKWDDLIKSRSVYKVAA